MVAGSSVLVHPDMTHEHGTGGRRLAPGPAHGQLLLTLNADSQVVTDAPLPALTPNRPEGPAPAGRKHSLGSNRRDILSALSCRSLTPRERTSDFYGLPSPGGHLSSGLRSDVPLPGSILRAEFSGVFLAFTGLSPDGYYTH